VLLGEVRALGFPLFLSCPLCNHSGEVAIDAFDGTPDGRSRCRKRRAWASGLGSSWKSWRSS
jgi:hypothetical protein